VRYKDTDGSTLIELRGNGQTVRRIAALALLARHWPPGSRHECTMALAGYLSTCGVDDEQVVTLVG